MFIRLTYKYRLCLFPARPTSTGPKLCQLCVTSRVSCGFNSRWRALDKRSHS